MLTKDKLMSEDYMRIYKYVGFNALDIFKRVEKTICTGKDFDRQIYNGNFTFKNNMMHFNGLFDMNEDGRYIKVEINKEKDYNPMDIVLNLGIEGYDLATGERYDRQQAKVSYTYENNKVTINDIKDEEYFNKLEEKRNKEIANSVRRLR